MTSLRWGCVRVWLFVSPPPSPKSEGYPTRDLATYSCTCEKHVSVFNALFHHSFDRHDNLGSC